MLSLFSLPRHSGLSTSSCSCFTSDLFLAPSGCLQNLMSSSHCVNLYYPHFSPRNVPVPTLHMIFFFQLPDAAAAIIPSNYAPYQLSREAVCCCAPSLVSSGSCQFSCVSFLHIPIQESSSSTALISGSCSLFCYFYHPASLCRWEEMLR